MLGYHGRKHNLLILSLWPGSILINVGLNSIPHWILFPKCGT